MTGPALNVSQATTAIRHHIRGKNQADAAVSSIEVLMHRHVLLDEWSLRSASNAFWRLYWPTSRGGRVTFQGVEHSLEPGYLYLISPHTKFNSYCTRPFTKWYLHFNAGGLANSCGPGIVRLRPPQTMRMLLKSACPLPRRTLRSTEIGTQSLDALQLVVLALRQALPKLQLSTQVDPRLRRCVDYLKDHIKEKIKLVDLATFAGVSTRALSYMFTAELGFPPMRYLIELRLNHAMKLLRHTDHKVEQIAEACGFANRYYFTRMLAKYRRTTPAAFRKRLPATS